MRLSLCIVGCGNHARTVLHDIHDMTEDIELFIASRDVGKAREYCQSFGGSDHFGSYEEAASDPRVDALYFFTPHHLHLDNALLAARNFKHILMEKPIARNIDESNEMIAAAREAGVRLMVAENYRFLPTVVKSKELISKGAIGDVRLIEIHFEGYSQYTGWRAKATHRGGGVFIDGGVHAVDMLVNLGGIPERVYAGAPSQLLDHVEGEDTIFMIGHLPGAGIGLITYSSETPIREGRQMVKVTGTKGQVRFAPFEDKVTLETLHGEDTVIVPEAREGIRRMVREFRDSVLQDREPAMSAEKALIDLAVVLGAYESMASGKEVELTLP